LRLSSIHFSSKKIQSQFLQPHPSQTIDPTPSIIDIPNLPSPQTAMTWRDLNQFGSNDRGSDFYRTCLEYSQVLWRQKLPARAILCLDRAWGADLDGSEPILGPWPLPYQALVHIMQHAPQEAFIGNPRVHFQHYADRLGEPRLEQRKWRSWACWALSCKARPELPGDPKHDVEEPTINQITTKLDQHGHPNETELWQTILSEIQ
jgi:hypothetical protein